MEGKHHEYLTIGAFVLALLAVIVIGLMLNGNIASESKAPDKGVNGAPAPGSVGTQGSAPALAPST